MLLPIPVNRAALRGFWLFVSLAAGIVAASAAPLAGLEGWGRRSGVGILAAAAIAMPGLIDPLLVWWPYRIWNWSARRFSRIAIRYVTAVAFGTVMVSLAGLSKPARFERAPAGTSRWAARTTQTVESYRRQHHYPPVPGSTEEGPDDFTEWRRRSGHPGAWALRPFAAFIEALETEPLADNQPVRNIYTLY